MYQKILPKNYIGYISDRKIEKMFENLLSLDQEIPYEDRIFYKQLYIHDGSFGTNVLALCDSTGALLTTQIQDQATYILGITDIGDLTNIKYPVLIAMVKPNQFYTQDLQEQNYQLSDKFITQISMESLGAGFYMVSSFAYNGTTYNINNGKILPNAVSLDNESSILRYTDIQGVNGTIPAVICQNSLITFTRDDGQNEYILSKVSVNEDTYQMIPLSNVDPTIVQNNSFTCLRTSAFNPILSENDCMLFICGKTYEQFELLYFNDGKLNYTIPEYEQQELDPTQK